MTAQKANNDLLALVFIFYYILFLKIFWETTFQEEGKAILIISLLNKKPYESESQ